MTLNELKAHLITQFEASSYINKAYYDWLQETVNDTGKTANYPIVNINPIPISGSKGSHFETYVVTCYLLESGHDEQGNKLSNDARDTIWSNQKEALDNVLKGINDGETGVSVERYRMDADEFNFNDLAISTKLEVTLSVWNKIC